jgi:hypothetical protein
MNEQDANQPDLETAERSLGALATQLGESLVTGAGVGAGGYLGVEGVKKAVEWVGDVFGGNDEASIVLPPGTDTE